MSLLSRPSRDENLIEHAYVTSMRGTCSRLKVGGVVAKEGRILTQGYNGAPAGITHCNHDCFCKHPYNPSISNDHHPHCPATKPCIISEHAERNAIAFAARHGVGLLGSTLYITHMPCLPCAMSIINAGIVRVVYAEAYRIQDGIDLLRQANVEVDQLARVEV